VALLSHTRKIIEKALDLDLKSLTKNHRFQCGFRSNNSIEQAILRFIAAKKMKHHYTAVLDLKGAYPSVSRSRLMKALKKRLPKQLCSQISMFMGTDLLSAVGDNDSKVYEMRMGVPEGSPLSPSIFNIYMDTLAVKLDATKQKYANIPCTIYADDVVLFAKTAKGLKKLLRICSDWAREFGMSWATDPGKSCVLVPPSSKTKFYLAGNILTRELTTRYLGVEVSWEGVVSAYTEGRMNAAMGRCNVIRHVGLTKMAHIKRIKLIYNSFIRPMYDFGIHLAPWSWQMGDHGYKVEKRLYVHPCKKAGQRAWVRYRNIIGIRDTKTRRKQLASKLYYRLSFNVTREELTPDERWMAELELRTLVSMYPLNDLTDPTREAEEKAAETERKVKKNRAPVGPENDRPILSLPREYSRAAQQWFFGAFPHPKARLTLEKKKGTEPYREHQRLSQELSTLLKNPSWTGEQRHRTITIMDRMTSITEHPLRDPERKSNTQSGNNAAHQIINIIGNGEAH